VPVLVEDADDAGVGEHGDHQPGHLPGRDLGVERPSQLGADARHDGDALGGAAQLLLGADAFGDLEEVDRQPVGRGQARTSYPPSSGAG
jgi:hypothetical protein